MLHHNRALDGVRGLAILLVLIWHFGPAQIFPRPDPHTLADHFYQLSVSTKTGVNLFFVLSGFLIGGILLDECRAANFLRVFYLRRVCRIFPLYFGWLAFYACLVASLHPTAFYYRKIFNPDLPLWPYGIFLQNLLGHALHGQNATALSVTWSLAVEEQFYLVMPWLVLFLPRRLLVAVLIVPLVVAPIVAYHVPHPFGVFNTFARCDALAWGVLLALAARTPPLWAALLDRRRLLFGVWMVIAAAAWLWPLTGLETIGLFDSLHNLSWVLLLFFTLGVPRNPLQRALCQTWLVRLGLISYGLYLLHMPILGVVFSVQKTLPFIYDRYDVYLSLLAAALTWLVASLLFRFYEKPITTWGHRFRYLHPPADQPVTDSSAQAPH